MSKVLNLIKWGATLGKDEQNFLGAKWIPVFLDRVPERSKRKWALRVLDLSPHYFLFPDDPKYKSLSKDEYLEAIAKDCRVSREEIWEKVLSDRVGDAETVIDYGCGPGFLTAVAAPHFKKIYGIDISDGALACARIIHGKPNIEYIKGDAEGLGGVPPADLVFTFHMLQHLSDEIASLVLTNMYNLLKPGGNLLAHLQIENEVWRSEDEWRSDGSVKGKIRLKYGLHCFGRSKEAYASMIKAAGFSEPEFTDLGSTGLSGGKDLDGQFIATAVRK